MHFFSTVRNLKVDENLKFELSKAVLHHFQYNSNNVGNVKMFSLSNVYKFERKPHSDIFLLKTKLDVGILFRFISMAIAI